MNEYLPRCLIYKISREIGSDGKGKRVGCGEAGSGKGMDGDGHRVGCKGRGLLGA